MSSDKRLIEVAFPLKQASLDSVHEKNVRHGHISTLHIWPARRPLAACRAALIATLLPDPGDPEERQKLLEKIGGKVVKKTKRKKTETGWVEEVVEETEGGILHWGRENNPDMDWFRQEIRKAYGGRAPKVLDPFAGGGAIPLEAMRLGCEATAVDINPVAWFILKCTLEYPQKLAGQTHPLPDFALQDREFMEALLKSKGYTGAALKAQLDKIGVDHTLQKEIPGFGALTDSGKQIADSFDADLAWHVRAWGMWVLKQARKELAPYYPTYADFEPLVEVAHQTEKRQMQLVPLKEDGVPDIDTLNAEFNEAYLKDKSNPRWVAKPTVAYLWARTVICKNCRATIPLLKTRWLCKKDRKRVVLTMQPNAEKTGVVFGVQNNVPVVGKTNAEKKANDAKVGDGTMSRSGAICPFCKTIISLEDIRLEGQANRLGSDLTAVVVDGLHGKEYRLPTVNDVRLAKDTENELDAVYAKVPFGLPTEPLIEDAKRNTWCVPYGVNQFYKFFTARQLVALGNFVRYIRASKDVMWSIGYNKIWIEAVFCNITCTLDKLLDHSSMICSWNVPNEQVRQVFTRFVLPMTWDFVEVATIAERCGAFESMIDSTFASLMSLNRLVPTEFAKLNILRQSAIKQMDNELLDAIVTDPPYYDAIGYSILMDFFYVWLRRALYGLNTEIDFVFREPLAPKWDQNVNDGELIDDASRFKGDKTKSKEAYENGMFRAFQTSFKALSTNGRLIVVFANKHPNAWEALVSAIIRAGFIVNSSWPIQTERTARTRSLTSAALSSSIWLACKKRSLTALPGWDNKVLDEMHSKINDRLRDFWDAGIRGPDFVWAATGPALEAYSQYPVVKKANQPGEVMTVSEFLVHVRRMVVDFVVGRVLSGNGSGEVSGLDNITTYYLLHRHDFGLKDAPAGPCILYAVSCGLSDKDLADRYDLLARRGGKEPTDEEKTGDDAEEESEGSGSAFRLKAWNQRKKANLGYIQGDEKAPSKQISMPDFEPQTTTAKNEIPLIDQIHRLMLLWKGGDVSKVNEYLDLRGLRRNPLFHQVLQALIELALVGSEERSLLESISNHVGNGKTLQTYLFT